MDGISAWFHQTLNVDPSMGATLLRFFVEEQDRLGTGRERITRVWATIGGVMDQESLGRALSVLANVPKAQLLVEWSNVAASTHCAVASTWTVRKRPWHQSRVRNRELRVAKSHMGVARGPLPVRDK